MKWLQKHKGILVEVVCYLFLILFVYAAATKLMEYEKFRVQVGQSPILTSLSDWVAPSVPTIELVLALMLFIPRLRLMALYASFSLMVMFSVYIFLILNFSPYVPCSCGGILEKMGWEEHLIFNIVFVLLAMVAILLQSSETYPPPETMASEPPLLNQT